MHDLFPPSQERESNRLHEMMLQLVHDRARVDPDSRHFHAMNPVACELDAAAATVRRATTRPWAADVRQAGAVKKAPAGYEEESDTLELLQGVPDRIRLHRLRRYSGPNTTLVDNQLNVYEPQDVVAVERRRTLYIQAGDLLFQLDQNGQLNEDETAEGLLLVNNRPTPSLDKVKRPAAREGQIQVQVEGLNILYAGRGETTLKVNYVGLKDYEQDLDIQAIPHLTEPLYLVHENGARYDYTLNGGIIEPDAHPAEYLNEAAAPDDEVVDWSTSKGVLYYAGQRSVVSQPAGTVPLHRTLKERISMKDWAADMAELPRPEDIETVQREEYVGRVRLSGVTVDVTKGGYVGNTYTGHRIHHLLNGMHYVIVVGEGNLSIVEPESGYCNTYSIPVTTVGVTWVEEGLLGLVTYEEGAYNVYAISETRLKSQQGFTVTGTIRDQDA